MITHQRLINIAFLALLYFFLQLPVLSSFIQWNVLTLSERMPHTTSILMLKQVNFKLHIHSGYYNVSLDRCGKRRRLNSTLLLTEKYSVFEHALFLLISSDAIKLCFFLFVEHSRLIYKYHFYMMELFKKMYKTLQFSDLTILICII